MKILIICQTMTYLSGSPLYNYTLAIELKKQGHDVHFLSNWADNDLKKNLTDKGVVIMGVNEVVDYWKSPFIFDVAFVSQRSAPPLQAKKTINIIHSEYDCETPIMSGIDHYVAIRPSIKEHLIESHEIPEDKITVIYNGVDLERFKPLKKTKRKYVKVVIPCTLDGLREKFLQYYTAKAKSDYKVYIFGKDFGANFIRNENVIVSDEVMDIEKHIGDADIVAGILLGRVNLEARAMDIKSYIHNPDNPEDFTLYYPSREEFDEKHDIKKVAEYLLKI